MEVGATGGFDAFISYSRRASTTLAGDLQVAVERFAKPWYRLRAIRVFRDDASMSANTALWSTIERGLTEADWLVLLASPAAAQSQYVAKEVEWWRAHKSSDRILIVLEEGVDIAWSGSDFDFSVTDSLPRALSGAYAEEPRWIDLRWYEATGSLGAQDPRWPERVADIAAAVRMVERDELVGENVRQHRRAQRLLRAGLATLSLLLVASLVATYVAVGQRSEARRQRDEAATQARIALARQLAAQAVSLSATDLPTASLLAVQAYRTNEDRQTRAALFQVAAATPELVRALPVGATVTATAVTPDGVVVTGDEEGGVTLWRDGEPTELMTLDGVVLAVEVSDDGSVVVATTDDRAVRWDGAETPLSGGEPIAVSADGATVASTTPDGVAVTRGGAEIVVASGFLPVELALPDDELVGLSTSGDFVAVDLATGESTATGFHDLGFRATGVDISADGTTMVGATGRSTLPVWRGEVARTSAVDPNATVDSALGNSDLAVSDGGTRVASLADGFVEVDAVRGPGDPVVPRIRLDGSGVAGKTDTLSFGGERWLSAGSGTDALVFDLDRVTRLGSAYAVDVPVPCTACGPGTLTVTPDGTSAVLSGIGVADPLEVDLATGASGPAPAYGTAALPALPQLDDEDVVATAVSGDRAVVATYEGSILDVDLGTGEARALTGQGEGFAVVAPDLSSVAFRSYEDGVMRVVDVAADRVLLETDATTAAYDGAGRLHLFDGETEQVVVGANVVEERAARMGELVAPALDASGDLAVAGGRDGTPVQLVDLDSDTVLASFPVPQDNDLYPVSAFTPDGESLVTAYPGLGEGGVGTVRTLSLDPDTWIAAACALAARDLTEADWDRYGVGPAPSDLECLQ